MQPGHDTKGDVLPGPIAVIQQGGNPLTNPSAGRKLLDVAELNAGSSAVVTPGVPIGFPGNPVRLLDLHADSKEGQVVTVTMSQQLQTNQYLPTYPIRGIVEFGNGGAVSNVEFDIPPPDTSAVFGSNQSLTFPKSGVSLSLPAGSLRVYARNDANAPFLQGPGVIGSGSFPGITFVDPTVFAHVSYNAAYGSVPPTRTVFLRSNLNPIAPLSPLPTICNIPPFATGVRFAAAATIASGNISPALIVTVSYDVTGIQSFTYNVAAGTDGHIEFGQSASMLSIFNPSATVTIAGLAAIFDIGNF